MFVEPYTYVMMLYVLRYLCKPQLARDVGDIEVELDIIWFLFVYESRSSLQ